jgi:hypothetical protein
VDETAGGDPRKYAEQTYGGKGFIAPRDADAARGRANAPAVPLAQDMAPQGFMPSGLRQYVPQNMPGHREQKPRNAFTNPNAQYGWGQSDNYSSVNDDFLPKGAKPYDSYKQPDPGAQLTDTGGFFGQRADGKTGVGMGGQNNPPQRPDIQRPDIQRPDIQRPDIQRPSIGSNPMFGGQGGQQSPGAIGRPPSSRASGMANARASAGFGGGGGKMQAPPGTPGMEGTMPSVGMQPTAGDQFSQNMPPARGMPQPYQPQQMPGQLEQGGSRISQALRGM